MSSTTSSTSTTAPGSNAGQGDSALLSSMAAQLFPYFQQHSTGGPSDAARAVQAAAEIQQAVSQYQQDQAKKPAPGAVTQLDKDAQAVSKSLTQLQQQLAAAATQPAAPSTDELIKQLETQLQQLQQDLQQLQAKSGSGGSQPAPTGAAAGKSGH